MYIFTLPNLEKIFQKTAGEPMIMPRAKRQNPRPISERKKLEDMVQCRNCHDCIMRKAILLIEGNPEKICEHCMTGVCALEESRWAHTLEEVGQIFGITRERVRQIELTALRKLRHVKRSKRLRPFYLDSLEREKENSRPYRIWGE